jgi:hypothetical protein
MSWLARGKTATPSPEIFGFASRTQFWRSFRR